jgi:hypothetical protein
LEVERFSNSIKSSFLKRPANKPTEKFSTADFWRKYKTEYPNLTTLAYKLLNVPASSANIERFFSIAGVVSKPRTGNMKNDLLIQRSLLKVNLQILDSI